MWRRGSDIPADERRFARWATIAATTLFALVLCEWRPWRLFARGGFTGDFYDVQAQAFLHGRLSVPADIAAIEGFLIDGKTYLYYGPFLAIARLPTALFSSWTEGRLSRLSMIVAFVLLCTVTFHLARRITRLIGVPPGAAWRPALLVAAVACSPVFALAATASVYHETELWAFVLILATFVAVVDLMADPTIRNAVLAAGAACATVMTRVSVGFGACVAVAIAGALIWRRDRRIALVALGIVVGGVLVHVGLNVARFGTLLDLPADRQVLTLVDSERAAWFAGNGNSFFGLRFLPTTIFHYARPDALAFERLVPFIRFGPTAREFGSYPLESNTPASSLTASATLLVVAGSIGLVLAIRRRVSGIVPLLIGAAVAAGPTLAIGFIANRYLVDLLPGLVVLAAVATATFHTTRRTVASVAVWVLVGWGLWVNVSLALWIANIERPGFTEMRYRIDDTFIGGAPPSVIDLRSGEPVPRSGVVAIDGPCDGLYIASQGNWITLELAEGVRRINGTFDPRSGPEVLIGEGDERITIVRGNDELVVTYQPPSGPKTIGDPIPWDGDEITLDIVSDPTAGGLNRGLGVRIDGQIALRDFATPDLTTFEPGDGLTVADSPDGGVPICADLVRRRSR